MSIDGSGGVGKIDSSFVPTTSILKYHYISIYYMNCLNLLRGGFAFKICDPLNSCAAHNN
jgi:hypothetical protein